MSWTTPTTRATGDLITASIWNTDVVNDLLALHERQRKNTIQDVASTTNETDLLNGEITIPALGVDDQFDGELWGSLAYNNSTSDTLRIRVRLGGTGITGTVVLDSGAAAPNGATSAARAVWHWMFKIQCRASTTTYGVHLFGDHGALNSGTVGNGGWGSAIKSLYMGSIVSGGGDLASPSLLAITAQWSASSAADSLQLHGAEFQRHYA